MKLVCFLMMLQLLPVSSTSRELIIGSLAPVGPVRKSNAGDHPFFVQSENEDCGGSLIGCCTVLTAKHCNTNPPPSFKEGDYVRIGGTKNYGKQDGERRQIRKWYPYDGPTTKTVNGASITLRGDIGIFCLKKRSTKKPVTLSFNARPANHTNILVMGHGNTTPTGPDSSDLRETDLIVNNPCLVSGAAPNPPVTDDTFCSSATEPNEGTGDQDSGGPVLQNNVLIGVIRGGYPVPGMNADTHSSLEHYKDWIEDKIKICDNYPGCKGDPHLTMWDGEKYDFHGVCDLVLLQNPKFNNDLGMDIHIRTKRIHQWSYISSVVLRIGQDTLEVMGGRDKNQYWFNQKKGNEESAKHMISASSIGGYPIQYTWRNPKSREFVIALGNESEIVIKTWNAFVSVSIQGGTYEDFGSSLGLMGTYSEGHKMSRDNGTILNDNNAFGEEWQVLSSEPNLFHNVEGPQAPEKCEIPSLSEMRRRLGQSKISKEAAEVACSRVSLEDYDICVFDVMATNDEDAAGAY